MRAPTEALLVDDNPGDTDLTTDVPGQNSCPSHIHPVLEGAEAMAFLRCEGKYPDTILPHPIMLDLNMPWKDGISVLAEVKSVPTSRTIPILVFSSPLLAPDDVARSYDAGANNYVGKPSDLNGFVTAVAAIGDFWFGVASVAGREGL
jgi:CheY-like chemotaxis protein